MQYWYWTVDGSIAEPLRPGTGAVQSLNVALTAVTEGAGGLGACVWLVVLLVVAELVVGELLLSDGLVDDVGVLVELVGVVDPDVLDAGLLDVPDVDVEVCVGSVAVGVLVLVVGVVLSDKRTFCGLGLEGYKTATPAMKAMAVVVSDNLRFGLGSSINDILFTLLVVHY